MKRISVPVIDEVSGEGRVLKVEASSLPAEDGLTRMLVAGQSSRPGAFDVVLEALESLGPLHPAHYVVQVEDAGTPVRGRSSRLGLALAAFCEARRSQSRVPGPAGHLAVTGDLRSDGTVLPVDAETLPSKAASARAAGCDAFVVPSSQVSLAQLPGLTVIGVDHLRDCTEDPRILVWRRPGVTELVRRRPLASTAVAVSALLVVILIATGIAPLGTRPLGGLPGLSSEGTEFRVEGLAGGHVLPSSYARRLALRPDGRIVIVGTGSEAAGSQSLQIVAGFLPDGRPERAFGDAGVVLRDVGRDLTGVDVIIDPDGAIVVAGSAKMTLAGDFSLSRYLPDGEPDPRFGEDGFTWTQVAYDTDRARAVRHHPAGGYVVAGDAHSGVDYDLALLKYAPDGTLDTEFGNDGIVVEDIEGRDGFGGMTVDEDGLILAVGRGGFRGLAARYLPNGMPDPGFGDAGKVVLAAAPGYEEMLVEVISRPGGGYLTTGYSRMGQNAYDLFVVGLRPDGSLDPAFGDGGRVGVDLGSVAEEPVDLAVLEDGRIAIVGRRESDGQSDLMLVVLDQDGALLGEPVLLDVGGGDEIGYDVAVEQGGSLLIAGASRSGGLSEMLLLRVVVE
ncbi:MAG: hypothetical protein HKN29_14250 [Rhodothermales bacterium]|nr:hypothetical protein [Rhodothermales bacterium]